MPYGLWLAKMGLQFFKTWALIGLGLWATTRVVVFAGRRAHNKMIHPTLETSPLGHGSFFSLLITSTQYYYDIP
jgi:hypothetical protein